MEVTSRQAARAAGGRLHACGRGPHANAHARARAFSLLLCTQPLPLPNPGLLLRRLPRLRDLGIARPPGRARQRVPRERRAGGRVGLPAAAGGGAPTPPAAHAPVPARACAHHHRPVRARRPDGRPTRRVPRPHPVRRVSGRVSGSRTRSRRLVLALGARQEGRSRPASTRLGRRLDPQPCRPGRSRWVRRGGRPCCAAAAAARHGQGPAAAGDERGAGRRRWGRAGAVCGGGLGWRASLRRPGLALRPQVGPAKERAPGAGGGRRAAGPPHAAHRPRRPAAEAGGGDDRGEDRERDRGAVDGGARDDGSLSH